jgi:hypothetical protein
MPSELMRLFDIVQRDGATTVTIGLPNKDTPYYRVTTPGHVVTDACKQEFLHEVGEGKEVRYLP